MQLFSDIKFINSKRGRQLILHREYTYGFTKHYSRKNSTYWQCTGRTTTNCKGRIEVSNYGKVISGNLHHSHPPPQFYIRNGYYFRI